MDPLPLLRGAAAAAAFALAAAAQDWTDEQLWQAGAGFLAEAPAARVAAIGALVAEQKACFSALVARIHGDHREYLLKIDRLLDELTDPSWQVREEAERTLIEIGARARSAIQERKDKFAVLEQSLRCARILDALAAKGGEQEEREIKLLRGLVATALYLEPEPRLLRALKSALGHTDALVVDGALRALGKHGGDDEADAVRQMLAWKGGLHRLTALGALGRMRSAKALATCRELLTGGGLGRTDALALLRALRARDDAGAQELVAALAGAKDPLLAAAARQPLAAAGPAVKVRGLLADRSHAEGTFDGLLGESTLLTGAFAELPRVELPFAESDTLEFPDHAVAPAAGVRVFLNQGSLLLAELRGIDPEGVRIASPWFGELVLPRSEVQGIALDPSLDRMVGASPDHARLRLRSGEFVDGALRSASADAVAIEVAGAARTVPLGEIAGILLPRPRAVEPDTTIYTRLDLTNGERLIAFVAASSPSHLVVAVPGLGAAALPLTSVARAELGVGGGAMWGFTLVADYSENKVVEVDDQGRVVFVLEEVFGAWDAECLDSGNLLITEFSVSRVREINRKGENIWVFEDLKNPYDADRLPNGNTLIADTFGSRVIEVDAAGKVVWSYAKEIRPFDCDRLPNGNTLIADVLKERVLEVSAEGEIVWEARSLPNVHDADRLPNGNTMVTLRNKGVVMEIDREGKVVWELPGLSSPSDADRLPNGNTVVAENTRVREFDRRGNVVWQKEMTWAVEVNRY